MARRTDGETLLGPGPHNNRGGALNRSGLIIRSRTMPEAAPQFNAFEHPLSTRASAPASICLQPAGNPSRTIHQPSRPRHTERKTRDRSGLVHPLPGLFSDLGFWLGGQDSNLDEVLQRHLIYY